MADPTNKVPFPFAGDGAVLRFRTADLIKLEEIYGDGWQSTIHQGFDRQSHKTLVDCLRAGLKQEDGRKPFARIDYDDLPFSLYEAAMPIIEAIALAISGQSYAALLEASREASANPPEDDETDEHLGSELSPLDMQPGS